MPLAVAGVHAVEHLRPVLGFGAARSRVQRKHGVAAVIVAAHERFQLQCIRVLGKALQLLLAFGGDSFVLVLGKQLQHSLHIIGTGFQPLDMVELAFNMAYLAVDRGGTLQIVPEFRGVHLFLQFRQLLAQMGELERVGSLGHGVAQTGKVLFHPFLINHTVTSLLGAGRP